jgi:hypothetical protein
MKTLLAIVLVAAVGGCTSVKMVQREGCWVKRTEKSFGRVNEELGPCASPASSPWAEDRVTRLAQECIAREDHRWQTRAVAAWSRGGSPPEANGENVLQTCLDEATKAVAAENDALKQRLAAVEDAHRERLQTTQERLAEVKGERDAIRTRVDQDLARALERDEKLAERLLDSNHLLAGHLGEAAKKPSPPAVATATASSDGRARNETLGTTETAEAAPGAVAPVSPVAVVNTMPFVAAAAPAEPATAAAPAQPTAPVAACPAPASEAKSPARARARSRLARAKAPACDPAVAPVTAAVPAAPAIVTPAQAAAVPSPGADAATAAPAAEAGKTAGADATAAPAAR